MIVLTMLRAGPQSTADFLDAGLTDFAQALGELRKAGYHIASEPIRDGYLYTLDREPEAA